MYKKFTPKHTSTSVLESNYFEPTRPYSQDELSDMRINLFKKFHLSNTRAEHIRCGHFYNVIINGKKEKDINTTNVTDSGNCSVCWKLNKTPVALQNNAYNLVSEYCDTFFQRPKRLSHPIIDLENSFYKWLYNEFN